MTTFSINLLILLTTCFGIPSQAFQLYRPTQEAKYSNPFGVSLLRPLFTSSSSTRSCTRSCNTSSNTSSSCTSSSCTTTSNVAVTSDPLSEQFAQNKLDPSQEKEEYLDALLNEALLRMSFFMETDYLLRTENNALRSLFGTCVDIVYVDESTIAQAGRGLFAGRDIPKGTIVAFYPIDSIGVKFESGLCNSVQLAQSKDEMIDTESSSYTLFSLGNRKLCGVDVQEEFDNGRLFVDMNPKKCINAGWYCGFINDAATVRYQGDVDYYTNSRSAQNVDIIPFSAAPFQVGITTRHVKQGEELFVSYGYNYWVDRMVQLNQNQTAGWEPKPKAIEEQENEAASRVFAAIDATEEKYKEASWVLSHIYNNMNSEEPPSATSPQYPMKNDSNSNGGRVISFLQSLKKLLKRDKKQ